MAHFGFVLVSSAIFCLENVKYILCFTGHSLNLPHMSTKQFEKLWIYLLCLKTSVYRAIDFFFSCIYMQFHLLVFFIGLKVFTQRFTLDHSIHE